MKHLLPLFLIFSFSTKATASSCFSSDKQGNLLKSKVTVGRNLARSILKIKVTFEQAQALTFLEKKLSKQKYSLQSILKTLNELKEMYIFEDDINNIFIPVMSHSKFDKKGTLQNYIAQGQVLARSTLDKYVTPYQALQLFNLIPMLKDHNTNASNISKSLEKTNSFSEKDIVTFIIKVANSYDYNFGEELVSDLAYGQQIAHKILERPATPEQALALFFLEEELSADSSPDQILETLKNFKKAGYFSTKEINKLMDSILYSTKKEFEIEMINGDRGQEIAFGILGEPVTPKQARGLTFLEEELSDISSPADTLEILKTLEEQGFSEDDINNTLIPVLLDPKFDKKGTLQNHIIQSQKLARENLGKETTPLIEALQLLVSKKED